MSMFGNAAIFSNNFGDTTPPNKPSLSQVALTDTSIIISGSSTDNIGVVEYDVYLDSVLYDNIIGASFTGYSIGGLTPETNYDIYIIAKDLKGNESLPSDTINFTTEEENLPYDIVAPTWSGNNLSYTAVTATTATLNWTAASDNVGVTGYDLYRNDVLLLSIGNVLTYDLTGLTQLTAYTFKLKATDAAGNVSTFSNTVGFTTSDGVAPSKPVLSYHTLTGTSVMINGSSSDNVGVVEYDVYLNSVFNKTIASSYFTNELISGLNDVTGYSIYITAKDAAGNESVASDTVSFTTLDATDPSKPSLTYANVTHNSIAISGTATDNVAVTYYKIYVDEVLSENINGASLSSYVVDGLTSSTNYDIFIVAVDAAGNESLPSDIINFTTDAAPVSGAKPLLTNFHIDNAQPSRVYFDASADVTGLTTTGFVISGKTISSVTIDGDGLGGYFTVSVPFTFWDNNTIRLGENDNLTDLDPVVHNFTMEYIVNNINEPTAATNRFVSVSGGGDGTSEASPWTWAQAVTNVAPGMTIWVKAGNYGHYASNIDKAATPTNPIKFIGYETSTNGVPNVITDNYFDYGVTMSTSKMPTFTNTTLTSSGVFLYLRSGSLIFKNFQFINYFAAFRSSTSGSNSCKNVYFDRINTKDAYETWQTSQTAFYLYDGAELKNLRIKNSVLINNSMGGITIQGSNASHNLIDNCKSYSDRLTTPERQDYHFTINGLNSIIRNSYCENFNSTSGNGSTHGITIRSVGYTSQHNLIVDCTAVNAEEGIAFRNENTGYNVAKRCLITNNNTYTQGLPYSGGVWFFGSDDYNIIENTKIEKVCSAIGYRGDSGESTNDDVGNNNIFRNVIIDDCRNVFYILADADSPYNENNSHYNLTINNCPYLISTGSVTQYTLTNFNIKNSIFSGVTNIGMSFYGNQIVFVNNNFYNSWTTGLGTGSTNVNPNFVDTIDFEPQTEMYKPLIEGVFFDYSGTGERAAQTTIGAVKHANEVVDEVTPPVTYTPDYYVSSSTGNDSNDGLTELTAWQTLSKVATQYNAGTFNTGKVVAFKKGDTFTGQMSLSTDSGTAGNEIVFTSYGTGNRPILSAVQDYSSITWTSIGGNIWYESVLDRNPYRVMIDGSEVLGEFYQYSNLGTSIPDLVEFYWGSGPNGTHLYVYSVTDPNTRTFNFSSHQSGQSYYNAMVTMTGTDYVIFDDIEFAGGYYSSALLRDVNNIQFNNCTFGRMAYQGITSELSTTQSTNVIVDNCTFDTGYTFDYSGAGTYSGASVRGANEGVRLVALTGGEIKNSTFVNWCHASISMTSESQETITGIKVFSNTFSIPDMPYGGGFTTDGLNTHDNEIYNNNFISVKAQQINGYANHFHHNIINRSVNSPLHTYTTGYGVSLQNYYEGSHDNIIENNVIIESEGFGIYVDDSAVDNIIRNNILYNCGSGWNNVSMYIGSSPNTYQNNDIYSTLRSDPVYYASAYRTVTAFNALNGNLSNVISNNISGNPTFVSTTNFHLQSSSPAINAGITPTATVDRDGNTIPFGATNPDIGAYEYGY